MTLLFQPAQTTSAYLKMGMMGFAGSGKTYTATSVAIGLVEMMRELKTANADRPIFFLDTEQGSDWVLPRIRKHGIEVFTAKTRAFADLLAAVPEAQESASVLLVDSLTDFWVELCDTYMKKKNRTRLQFDDWAFLKVEWRKFTDLFINSELHTIVCGRAGFEYDYIEDTESGTKNLEKTGIRMKAEGEMGYEPSLLVLMERRMNMTTMTDEHVARVVKDRATLLVGKEFADPTFEHFLPHIQCLNIGGKQLGVDTSRTSAHMIPREARDQRAAQRKIVVAEIQDLLFLHFPAMTKEDKTSRITMGKKHFNATWTEVEEYMPLEKLRAGYDSLHRDLEGKPSRYSEALEIATAPAAPTINGAMIAPARDPDVAWLEQFMGA